MIDRRNYFMINLHESMGPDRDLTRDPWICSQTHMLPYTLPTALCGPYFLECMTSVLGPYLSEKIENLPLLVACVLVFPLHFLSTVSVASQWAGSPLFKVFTITFVLVILSQRPQAVLLYLHTEKNLLTFRKYGKCFKTSNTFSFSSHIKCWLPGLEVTKRLSE